MTPFIKLSYLFFMQSKNILIFYSDFSRIDGIDFSLEANIEIQSIAEFIKIL